MNKYIEKFLDPIINGEHSPKFKKEEVLKVAVYVLENDRLYANDIAREFNMKEEIARKRLIALSDKMGFDGVGVLALHIGYKRFLEKELERLS